MKKLLLAGLASLMAVIAPKKPQNEKMPSIWQQQPMPYGDDDDDDPTDGNRDKSFQQLMGRYNNATAAGEQLFQDNFKLREERRGLKKEVKDLKDKLPEGSVVLTKEQAAQWTAYQELGKPEEVKASLETGKASTEKLTTMEKGTQIAEAAKAANMNPDVFAKLVGMDALEVSVKEVTVDGKPVKAVYVKTAAGVESQVLDYAKSNWAPFEAALTAPAGGGENNGGGAGNGQNGAGAGNNGAGGGQNGAGNNGNGGGTQWGGAGAGGAGNGNNGGSGNAVETNIDTILKANQGGGEKARVSPFAQQGQPTNSGV